MFIRVCIFVDQPTFLSFVFKAISSRLDYVSNLLFNTILWKSLNMKTAFTDVKKRNGDLFRLLQVCGKLAELNSTHSAKLFT